MAGLIICGSPWLGGFLGVMGFIGVLVFWDRRTFMKRAREEMRSEVTVRRMGDVGS